MNSYRDIIKEPIVTEKTAALGEQNTIVFSVDPKANKTQIKQAVEKIYNVKVTKVNTINVRPKKKRVGRYMGATSAYKKAIITLAEGSNIEI